MVRGIFVAACLRKVRARLQLQITMTLNAPFNTSYEQLIANDVSNYGASESDASIKRFQEVAGDDCASGPVPSTHGADIMHQRADLGPSASRPIRLGPMRLQTALQSFDQSSSTTSIGQDAGCWPQSSETQSDSGIVSCRSLVQIKLINRSRLSIGYIWPGYLQKRCQRRSPNVE
jgi:hypothetical protein